MNTYNDLTTLGHDYLAHYGILGMKWGRRKQKINIKKMSKRKKRLIMGLAATGLLVGFGIAKRNSPYMKFARSFVRKSAGTSKKILKRTGKNLKRSGKLYRRFIKGTNRGYRIITRR